MKTESLPKRATWWCPVLCILSICLMQPVHAAGHLPAHQLHHADTGSTVTLRFSLDTLARLPAATDISIAGVDVQGMTVLPDSLEVWLHVTSQGESRVSGSTLTAVIDGQEVTFGTGPFEIAWFDQPAVGSLLQLESRTVELVPMVHAFKLTNTGVDEIRITGINYAAPAATTGTILVSSIDPTSVLDADLPYLLDPGAPFDPDAWEGPAFTKRDAEAPGVVLAPGQSVAFVIGGEAFEDPSSFTPGRMWDFAPWVEYEEDGLLHRLVLPSSSRAPAGD